VSIFFSCYSVLCSQGLERGPCFLPSCCPPCFFLFIGRVDRTPEASQHLACWRLTRRGEFCIESVMLGLVLRVPALEKIQVTPRRDSPHGRSPPSPHSFFASTAARAPGSPFLRGFPQAIRSSLPSPLSCDGPDFLFSYVFFGRRIFQAFFLVGDLGPMPPTETTSPAPPFLGKPISSPLASTKVSFCLFSELGGKRLLSDLGSKSPPSLTTSPSTLALAALGPFPELPADARLDSSLASRGVFQHPCFKALKSTESFL